jgi:hypothetical protein
MKKLLLLIFLSLLLSSNAYSKYLEIVCAPDREWKADLKSKKIWFTSTKPKHIFHLDEENLRIIKIGYSKDVADLKSSKLSVEKIAGDKYQEFSFHTGANLTESVDAFNEFVLIDLGGIYHRFALMLNQYRLKPEQTKLIAKEMKNMSFTELQRAREKIHAETYMSLGRIDIYGGISASCENSEVRN